jgi:hypothetical protein
MVCLFVVCLRTVCKYFVLYTFQFIVSEIFYGFQSISVDKFWERTLKSSAGVASFSLFPSSQFTINLHHVAP